MLYIKFRNHHFYKKFDGINIFQKKCTHAWSKATQNAPFITYYSQNKLLFLTGVYVCLNYVMLSYILDRRFLLHVNIFIKSLVTIIFFERRVHGYNVKINIKHNICNVLL